MALREIFIYPDPVLKEMCDEVTTFDDELGQLLEDMAETMYEAPGVGLAAPQIGITKRITVVDCSDNGDDLIELVNPVIISRSGKISYEEGCLSIPEYRDTVERSETIVFKALDRNGQEFEREVSDLLSVCIQHEIDHLDGVLFIDRISRLKRDMFKRWYKKRFTE